MRALAGHWHNDRLDGFCVSSDPGTFGFFCWNSSKCESLFDYLGERFYGLYNAGRFVVLQNNTEMNNDFTREGGMDVASLCTTMARHSKAFGIDIRCLSCMYCCCVDQYTFCLCRVKGLRKGAGTMVALTMLIVSLFEQGSALIVQYVDYLFLQHIQRWPNGDSLQVRRESLINIIVMALIEQIKGVWNGDEVKQVKRPRTITTTKSNNPVVQIRNHVR